MRYRPPMMWIWVLLFLGGGGWHAVVRADIVPLKVENELKFADRLMSSDLQEYAEKVINRLALDYPAHAYRTSLIRARILVAKRKLKEAEQLFNSLPKENAQAQAVMLALADAFYQAGEMDRCNRLYAEFFAQYTNKVATDTSMIGFYRDSAHKYGQMLAYQNDYKGAAMVYKLLVQSLPSNEVPRQIRAEWAELLLKAAERSGGLQREALVQEAETNVHEVLWGGTDLWFGRALIGLAHVEILRGRKEEAEDLLHTNMKMLKKMDQLIEEYKMPISESPFAGVRSLLGQLYRDNAELLLGSKAERQTEALRLIQRTWKEVAGVWDLAVRINKRDEALAERHGDKILAGEPAQRMKPYDDIAAAMAKIEDALTTAGTDGWEPVITGQVDVLRTQIATNRAALDAYPRGRGVTPLVELTLSDDRKGWQYMRRGLSYMGTEETRRQAAIESYAKALQEYYNVFASYPGSEWNAIASSNITVLKDKIKELTGSEVTIETRKGGKDKLSRVGLREAQSLFSRKAYAQALPQLVKAINELPEGEDTVAVLPQLIECYARIDDIIRVKMTAQYLAERFAKNPDAPAGLLRVAKYYLENKNREMASYMYELYLQRFPAHSAAPAVLFSQGEERWAAQDYDGALPFFRRVLQQFPRSTQYGKALQKIGIGSYLARDYTNAVPSLTRYLAEAQPGADKAQGKLCLADAYRQLGDFTNALKNYTELEQWLTTSADAYRTSAEEETRNQEVLEQAVFFRAFSLSRMDLAAGPAAGNPTGAIDLYRAFIERYPKSKMAPTAMSCMGALQLNAGNSSEATKTYDELAVKYPNSEVGQNARFAMVRSLMDIDQREKARQVFEEMLKDAGKFSSEQFMLIGQLMQDKGMNESAAPAFNAVVTALQSQPNLENDKALADRMQRAYFMLGKAQLAMNKPEEAVKSLEALVARFPRSGLFYEARFVLSSAYRALNRQDEALEALREVFRKAADQNLINRASLELANIQSSQGDKDGALASYQRIVLLAKLDNPANRSLYEEALVQSIALFGEKEKWPDVVENCERYFKMFPAGSKISEVRKWRDKATMAGVKSVAAPVEGGETKTQ